MSVAADRTRAIRTRRRALAHTRFARFFLQIPDSRIHEPELLHQRLLVIEKPRDHRREVNQDEKHEEDKKEKERGRRIVNTNYAGQIFKPIPPQSENQKHASGKKPEEGIPFLEPVAPDKLKERAE